jgi:hypothetical protein
MRNGLGILALLASVALVVPGSAQQTTFNNNNFVTGFTPQNITFKPVNFTSSVMPTNLQQNVMPQSIGPKVFDMGSVFHSFKFPLNIIPTRPTGQSVIKPGPGTPGQQRTMPVKKN